MPNHLTVMTFNICGAGEAQDPRNHWNYRRHLNVEVIQRTHPDILGLQEVQFGNLCKYTQALSGYHHYLGLNMDYGNFDPIFWKKEHFQLVSSGAFWLNAAQAADMPAKEWGAHTIRSATWVILEDKRSGNKICHVNTHLDHISEQARRCGASLILNRWEEIGCRLPTVITGDFNSGRWVPPNLGFNPPYTDATISRFEEAGFIDTYTEFHTDGHKSNTFHAFMGDAYDPTTSHGLWRVDWILVRDLAIQSCEIIRNGAPPLFPSDHYPVVAEVTY